MSPMKMKHVLPQVEFRTRDYWLAASLNAAGCEVIRLEWKGSRAFFVFGEGKRCEDLACGYWSGNLQVPARAMADALRHLKERLHLRGDEHATDQSRPQANTRTFPS